MCQGSCFLCPCQPLLLPFLSPILVCLWCLERYPDHGGSPRAAHSSLPLAIFYEKLRIEVPSLRTELGHSSSFSSLCPVLTTDSTDHGQAMEIFVCAVHSTQSQMSWPHQTSALSLPSPDNWSHSEDTLATSSPLESPMALTVSCRGSVTWVLKSTASNCLVSLNDMLHCFGGS